MLVAALYPSIRGEARMSNLRHRQTGVQDVQDAPEQGDHGDASDSRNGEEEDEGEEENMGSRVVTSVRRRDGVAAGLALVAIRVLGALLNPIPDCDETFNYWEPVHHLVYGFGQQTWEYSPAYTLRSYAYLVPHAIAAKVLDIAAWMYSVITRTPHNKVVVFYGVRVLLALGCASAEARFIDSVTRRLGPRTGALTLLLLLTSAGMFQASCAMLPSSAAMAMVMLTAAAWMRTKHRMATFLAVTAVLALGWPFVALLFLPLAVHVVYIETARKGLRRGITQVATWGVTSLLLTLPCVLAVDWYYYRRPVFPALNILLYNIGGGPPGAGDELYGVEPASYYVKNLLVNLNIAFPLSLLTPLTLALLPHDGSLTTPRRRVDTFFYLLPAYLWLLVMITRLHKEERFLFPIYPLLALAAALTIHAIRSTLHTSSWGVLRALSRVVGPLAVATHALLSLSRTVSMTSNYHAPLTLYRQLYHHAQLSGGGVGGAKGALAHFFTRTRTHEGPETAAQRVCVAGEWYRFPSSFFLPHEGFELGYVKSGFGGQLPQVFRPINGTYAEPLQPFNEYNREEPSRYVPLSTCTYFIELFPPPRGARDEQAVRDVLKKLGERDGKRWRVVKMAPFLDADASPSPYRAFWVPVVGRRKLTYGEYAVLERKR